MHSVHVSSSKLVFNRFIENYRSPNQNQMLSEEESEFIEMEASGEELQEVIEEVI